MKLFSSISAFVFPLLCITCVFCPDHFLPGMIQSFAAQISMLGLIFCCIFFVRRQILPAVSLLGSTLFLAGWLSPYLLPFVPVQKPKAEKMVVAHFNVMVANQDTQSLIHKAIATDATILSFQEVNTFWAKALEDSLKETYPYQEFSQVTGAFGLAVFSKVPICQSQEIEIQGFPILFGKVNYLNENILFAAVHTPAPTSPRNYKNRNDIMQKLSELLSESDDPTFVIGDFNIVPWAAQTKSFQDTAQLKDSRTSWSPTFPAWFSPLRIPIDYIFHSKHWTCSEFEVVHSGSSDHFGIRAEFYRNEREVEVNAFVERNKFFVNLPGNEVAQEDYTWDKMPNKK